MNISKEERYAMIRRAAIKIQKRNKIRKSYDRLAIDVSRLQQDDHMSEITYSDTDRYVASHFSETYQATTLED